LIVNGSLNQKVTKSQTILNLKLNSEIEQFKIITVINQIIYRIVQNLRR